MSKLEFVKIGNVKSPVRAHLTDAGIDFFIPDDFEDQIVRPNESILIHSGIKVKIPTGYALIFFNKSGVAAKRSLVLGSAVVDQDYQGELMYNLHNIGTEPQRLHAGDKIVQGILLPINYASVHEVSSEEELYGGMTSERGDGGFGSSGDK